MLLRLAPSPQATDNRLSEAFRESELNLRIRQSKVGYVLVLALVPAGVSLDWFVYPELLWKILQLRILCDIIVFPGLVLMFTALARRFPRFLCNFSVVLPTIAICWMIYASEGAFSPYYAGLNLLIVGACLLYPYKLREAAMFCAFVLIAYTTGSLLHRFAPPASSIDRGATYSVSTLYNNLYFLALTGIICVTACHYSSLRRFEDFKLRHDLDVNNRELAETLKKLQETEVQLVQSEKMNALGKLSAGLLHEINNPLNFTFMALQCAEQEAGGNAGLKETLADITQGMERIRNVIADLRAFAYPTKPGAHDVFSVDEALTTALRLTAHEVGDIVVERIDLGHHALAAKTQIVHLFMNLLVNSVQAMKLKPLGRTPKLTVSCAPRGERLEVTVLDNGTGVKADHLPRLFDPFFTTKDVGQGMGLGLSICHTIVKNHGGDIRITSEEGQWTRVVFDLPAGASGSQKP